MSDAANGFCNSSKVGWDVNSGDQCPDAKQYADVWIDGSWQGGPNEVHYPGTTYVCRLSGLASNLWTDNLEDRVGDDLIFPVNDCANQVDKNGNLIGCTPTEPPDKYNIIGFIVLQLDDVLDSAAEWGGVSQSHCDRRNFNVATGQTYFLNQINGGGCPSPNTPSAVVDFRINNQTSSPNWTYDDTNKAFRWTGAPGRVQLDFDWWVDGECGAPPVSSSAVCLKVHTVEVRFGGTAPGGGANFGLRAVRLCDLAFGSCPQE